MSLVNGEFSLRGMKFGTNNSGFPIVPGGFEVVTTEYRTQDEDNPMGDGLLFGTDYAGYTTYTWTILILRQGLDKWQAASQALEQFRALWRGSRVAREPGAMEQLNWYHGSEELISYGRPRHFAADRSELRKGIARVTCSFISSGNMAFSLQEYTTDLGYVPPSTGGLTAPLVAPLTAYGTGAEREGYITVGGVAPTPVRIVIHGPVTNPWVEVVGEWRVGITRNIPAGEYVEIDARQSTVKLNGQQSLAGALTRESPRLADLVLPPGGYEFVYGGSDATGTSHAELFWRATRYAV